ncbi:hypothetical protein F4819DRAFT_492910 [Hypoxylon fuscum]|nr:hypothetical protein F4819DRAFT_492910 [Hypoxylon fuscum]
MKIATSLSIILGVFLALVHSFEIPQDGLFRANFGSGSVGKVEMLALHNPNETVQPALPPSSSQELPQPLPINKHKCFWQKFLNGNDYELSIKMLRQHCADTHNIIGSKDIFGYQVGSSVAYMCNYGNPIECLPWELDDDMKFLDDTCQQSLVAGWVFHHHVRKTYGRDLTSEYICGNIKGGT